MGKSLFGGNKPKTIKAQEVAPPTATNVSGTDDSAARSVSDRERKKKGQSSTILSPTVYQNNRSGGG